MGNKNGNIHLFILEKMHKGSLGESGFKNISQYPAEQQIKEFQFPSSPPVNTAPTGQDPIVFLRDLNNQEKILTNERNELTRTKETLLQRITEEIAIRKRRIENYKAEIIELKQKCETLQSCIDPT